MTNKVKRADFKKLESQDLDGWFYVEDKNFKYGFWKEGNKYFSQNFIAGIPQKKNNTTLARINKMLEIYYPKSEIQIA